MRKTVVIFAIVVLVLGVLAVVVPTPLIEIDTVAIAAPVSFPELVETQPPLRALSSSRHLARASLPASHS